jgi:hypothetical protein
MVTCEGQLTIGIDGGMNAMDELEAFRLGAISTLLTSGAEAILQKNREGLDAEKQKLGHGMRRRATVQYIWGFPRPGATSKTLACHVITRLLFLKRGRATSSLGCYFQNGRRGPFLTQLLFLKTLTLPDFTRPLFPKRPAWPVITRLLPLKRRRRHQSLGCYL